ncbi:hypothetical protein [Corynebacterium sp. H130]|uniref:hypothetical protein n=1 Tax=Corynebacterium sp. H130 TaxID=3133444 RepID=UPI0030AF745C
MFIPAYEQYYPSVEDRQGLINGMQINLGMRAMYGKLYDPGTLGQLMAWEGAGWLMILSSVMAVLLTFRSYRKGEASSLGELARATGLSRLDIAVGTLILVTSVCLLLGLGVTGVLLGLNQAYGEIATEGAIAYGLAIAVSTLGSAMLAASISLLARDNHVRIGLLLVGVGYMSRALADVQGHDFFNWITPLGWFGLVRPFTDDRFWVLGIGLAVTAILAALWLAGERGREYGMSILPLRPTKVKRPRRIASAWQLRRLLDRGFHVTWMVTAFVISMFMSSLSSSMDDLLKEDEATGQIFKQMFGDQNLEEAFLTYMADFLGIVVAVAAVTATLKLRGEEKDRHVDLMRAQGISRQLPMQLQAASSLTFILEVAVAMALGSVLGVFSQSEHAETMWKVAATANASQVAPMLALAGLTALLIGLFPKQAWVAWLPIIYSALVTIIAPLFQAPEWLLKTSAFGHTIYSEDTSNWVAWCALVAVGAIGLVMAWVFAGKREIA